MPSEFVESIKYAITDFKSNSKYYFMLEKMPIKNEIGTYEFCLYS